MQPSAPEDENAAGSGTAHHPQEGPEELPAFCGALMDGSSPHQRCRWGRALTTSWGTIKTLTLTRS